MYIVHRNITHIHNEVSQEICANLWDRLFHLHFKMVIVYIKITLAVCCS